MATTSATRPGPIQQSSEPGAAAAPRQLRIEFPTAHLARFRSAWISVLRNGKNHQQASQENQDGVSARLPWHEHDIRELPVEEAAGWYRQFLESDRRQMISAQNLPAMRCAAVLFSEEKAELVWSVHPSLAYTALEAILREISANYGVEVRPREFGERVQEADVAAIREGSAGPNSTDIREAGTKNTTTSAAEAGTHELEAQLMQVWSSVLRTEITRTDEDFFTAGGHSLLAAKLLARIEAATGIELPIASLLDSPTIAKQAQLILAAQDSAAKPAPAEGAAIRRQQFFLLGGDPTFRPLSQSLAATLPFHSLGLQTSVVSGLGADPPLTQIADYFIREILARQPEGPYALGGWCAHGLLALEVAQQLKARGAEISKLVMLETANPVRLYAYSSWRRVIARRQLQWHLMRFEGLYLRHLGFRAAAHYLRARIAKRFWRAWRSVAPPEEESPANDAVASSKPRAHFNPLEVLYRAAAEYLPRPYDGPVLLVRATERTIGFASNERLGWDVELMPRMEIRPVPGNHYTIYMPPNVENLAKQIHGYVKSGAIGAA